MPPQSALDELLASHYAAALNAVWGVPSLHPNQEKALVHLGDPSKPRHILFVERTRWAGQGGMPPRGGLPDKEVHLIKEDGPNEEVRLLEEVRPEEEAYLLKEVGV